MVQDPILGLGDAITAPHYRTVKEAQIIAFLISPYAFVAGKERQDAKAASAALERCVTLGLPFRIGRAGDRLFDPVEVVNGIRNLHFSHGEPIWMQRSVAMLRRLMAEAVADGTSDAPPDLARLGEGRYAITIRRRFNVAGYRPDDRLRLRLPLPLEDFSDVHLLPPVGLQMNHRIFPGRLEVQLTVPEATSEIEIGVRMRFIARPGALSEEPPPDDAARELWTRRREGLINVDCRIHHLARTLTAGASDPWVVMGRLWDHLFDSFRLGFIHYDGISAADPLCEILRTRRFDCLTGSSLLAALCRAVELPARVVSGYTLNPVMPTAHSWCEVWLPGSGWAAFDLYAMELAGGDRNSPWRQHFFGQIDHRLVSERLPLFFCGTGTVRLPPFWQLISCRRDEGAENRYEVPETGALIFSEIVDVIRQG